MAAVWGTEEGRPALWAGKRAEEEDPQPEELWLREVCFGLTGDTVFLFQF